MGGAAASRCQLQKLQMLRREGEENLLGNFFLKLLRREGGRNCSGEIAQKLLRREGEEEGDEGELERLRKGKYIPSRRLVHLGLSDVLLILVMLVLMVKIFQLILTIREAFL